jgi:hypothetical protein
LATPLAMSSAGTLDKEPAPLRRGFHGLSSPRAGAVCFRPAFKTQTRFSPARNVHVKFRLGGVGRPSPAWAFFQKLGRRTSRARRSFWTRRNFSRKRVNAEPKRFCAALPYFKSAQSRVRLGLTTRGPRQTTPPCGNAKDEADGGGRAGGQLPPLKIMGASPTSFQSSLGFNL